jgi:regulator of PEP synthase PpsR (kinase-PPPase family)
MIPVIHSSGAGIALHLLSDGTGETVSMVVEAALAQFSGAAFRRREHVLLRQPEAVDAALAAVEAEPGVVFYTLGDPDLSARVRARCANLGCEAVDVLEPGLGALGRALGRERRPRPGGRHAVSDDDYLRRVGAIEFAIASDDGRESGRYLEADVILTGVSRSSKTPTCIYLAGRGVRAANLPLAPGLAPPEAFLRAVERGRPVVGLTLSAARLAQIRAQRLAAGGAASGAYGELAAIREELAEAHLLFDRIGAPVIDVTRRSIEETAAEILALLRGRDGAP